MKELHTIIYVDLVSLLKHHHRHMCLVKMLIEGQKRLGQAIKQGFLEDCLVNWIKPIHKGGDKKIWYPTMDVSLLA